MAMLLELTTNITPEKAYFLGAVLVANENYVENGKKHWLAPIRHNPGQATEHNIKQHYSFLKVMSDNVGGETLSDRALGSRAGFSAGKKGFAVIFESTEDLTLDSVLQNLPNMATLSTEIKRSFLVGTFDGRSSFDRKPDTGDIRNIAIDCDDRNVHQIISALLSGFNISVLPYNEARERVAGGAPRKNQLRIPKRNVEEFAADIGFISPYRFKLLRQCFAEDMPFVKNEDSLLPGLKCLSSAPSEIVLEETVFDDAAIETANTEDVIPNISRYSGVPKAKTEAVLSKGRKTYQRNPQVAINALSLASYGCEIDTSHPTFTRRKNNTQYTEPHHLVPMSFSDRYDVSLDVEENIVSLCSHCHNLLHYGRDAGELLAQLLEKRKAMLESVGIFVDIEDLLEMYKLD